MAEAAEPIGADELLYRRIPASAKWFDPTVTPPLSPQAYRPRENDLTGISLYRAKGIAPEAIAARGRPGKSFYVATLRYGDLQDAKIEVVDSNDPKDPGHVELPALNADNRRSDEALEMSEKLVSLTRDVFGPFPGGGSIET
jgi:hypothetical protein